MTSRITVEIKGSPDSQSRKTIELSRVAKKSTMTLQKPLCKDGVCTLDWKPSKPAA